MILFLSPFGTQRLPGPLPKAATLHAVISNNSKHFEFWVRDHGIRDVYYKLITCGHDARGYRFSEVHETIQARSLTDFDNAYEISHLNLIRPSKPYIQDQRV